VKWISHIVFKADPEPGREREGVKVGALHPLQICAPTTNLKNIKDNIADQPAKKRATIYRIQVLPLLNRRKTPSRT
jgi:hypothetical protein